MLTQTPFFADFQPDMPFRPGAWPPDWPEIETAVDALMHDGSWGRYKSPHQEELREGLAEMCQVDHVRLCGSGSAAVELGLRAANVGSGHSDSIDEVVLAAFDYGGNFRAIEAVGARPVLVDVAPDGLSVAPDHVAALADDRTTANIRAVIASHLYGQSAAIESLREICDRRDWVLIEDACQVPGMTINDQAVGSFGHIGTLSFGGSKPLTAGNGGAVLTHDNRIAARLGALLDRPSDSQPLSVFQSAVLLPQLKRLAECNELRQHTVRFIESTVQGHLPRLRWLSQAQHDVSATHYKVAWACESAQHRSEVISQASRVGLPIGEGFRSMSRSSERRCRKPFPLDRSDKLGETAIVLDHSALLIESERHAELEKYLRTMGTPAAKQ